MSHARIPEPHVDLQSRTDIEQHRVVVDPSAGLPEDSAIIPNIEAWLKGRTPTNHRELLRHTFGDPDFTGR